MNQQSVVFDITALLGLNADKVFDILRQQAKEVPEKAVLQNSEDSFISFIKDGWDLQVHYTKSSKVVREFWLGRAEAPFKFAANEKERFIQAGNLIKGTFAYRVEFISLSGSDDYYDTAMIIPG